LAALAAEHPSVHTFAAADAVQAEKSWVLPSDAGDVRTTQELIGSSSVYSALVAVRVARLLGLSPEQIAQALDRNSDG
jgi:UDP-N-acetylmuramyl tripeptide synthase